MSNRRRLQFLIDEFSREVVHYHSAESRVARMIDRFLWSATTETERAIAMTLKSYLWDMGTFVGWISKFVLQRAPMYVWQLIDLLQTAVRHINEAYSLAIMMVERTKTTALRKELQTLPQEVQTLGVGILNMVGLLKEILRIVETSPMRIQ